MDLFADIDIHDTTELKRSHKAYVIRTINDEDVSEPNDDKDEEQHDPTIEEKQVAAICIGKETIIPILTG